VVTSTGAPTQCTFLLYDVMFPDGAVQQYAANLIAENIYSQVDTDGHHYQLLDCIMDYRTDGRALKGEDGWTISKNGKKTGRMTTQGRYFLIRWKGSTESWVPLKELKESHPIEVAEYAEANNLMSEPAIVWWAPYPLKKQNKAIAAVSSRSKKKLHKYGVEIPRSVKEAYELDRINGNTLW